jgi:hypothetical protein
MVRPARRVRGQLLCRAGQREKPGALSMPDVREAAVNENRGNSVRGATKTGSPSSASARPRAYERGGCERKG